jgi:hypothetical protein
LITSTRGHSFSSLPWLRGRNIIASDHTRMMMRIPRLMIATAR